MIAGHHSENASAAAVLVVDDEPLVRMTIADALADSGFNVLEAQDASEALETMTKSGQVAALITDVRMPGEMDGFELARRVSALWTHVRIFVMSGYVGSADSTLPAGAKFLQKPFNPNALVACVTASLR